jgi:hypothetical protein
MNTLNRSEGEQIGHLKPQELARLLRILLHSEAVKRNVLKHGIHVPLEIFVSDGGEDGRWKGDIEPFEYIPNSFTVYQSKAEGMTPTECRRELLPPVPMGVPKLKEKAKEVLEGGNATLESSTCRHGLPRGREGSRSAAVFSAIQ